MINGEATIRWKGYDPNTLSSGSNKKVWVICSGCERGRWILYCQYRDDLLCHACANEIKGKDLQVREKQSYSAKERWQRPGEKERISGKNSFFFDKHQCGKDNGFYGRKHSKESKQLMTKNQPDKLGSNNPNYKPEIDQFIEENQGKYFCQCGCGEEIIIKREYYNCGIPKFLQGHWAKTENGKNTIIRGNLAYKPKQRNTSIELKMQHILDVNGYQFETHKSLCNICQPDIVFPGEKIIIQCDGDYWHNYPDGTEKDRKQDKILTENGWKVIRFWEHEINDNIEDCFIKFESIYNNEKFIRRGI